MSRKKKKEGPGDTTPDTPVGREYYFDPSIVDHHGNTFTFLRYLGLTDTSEATGPDGGGMIIAEDQNGTELLWFREEWQDVVVSSPHVTNVIDPKEEVVLTARDQFAMAALTGLLPYYADPETTECCKTAAQCAYDLADAMLEVRSREGGEYE